MKTKSEKRKITVQLWTPLLMKLNQMTAQACLNRDAYLDVVFANESAMLASELAGRRNSAAARVFVKQCLLELKDLRNVTLTLDVATADAMKAACDQVNVWRDVFVNRVIYLLVAKPKAIEEAWGFEFKNHRQALERDGLDNTDLLACSRLAAIRGFVTDDAFLGIRVALREAYPSSKGAIHDIPLGRLSGKTAKERGLAGFSTYVQDDEVPGAPEYQEWQSLLDEDDAAVVSVPKVKLEQGASK